MPPVVFQFSGQGSQYRRMGLGLYRSEPVFRDTLDRLDSVARDELGASVLAEMHDERRRTEAFDDIRFTHPAIVMVELALADTLIHHGVEPDLLLGASLGEFTAAAVAGALDTEQCLRLVVRQARRLRSARRGGMLAVLADEELHRRVPVLRDRTEIAARNYPGHFVVAGTEEALDAAEDELRLRDVVCHRVPVSYPFHSSLMEEGEAAFRDLMAEADFRPPRLPVVSCVTGAEVGRMTVDHLWNAARLPIEYAATLTALERRGPHHYLDLGPSGTLHNFVRGGLRDGSHSRSYALLGPLADDARQLAAVRAALPARRRTHIASKDGTMKVCGFPGQGSQAKGMGRDLFDAFPEETATADRVLGYSIRELCLEDPRRELKLTQFTQPALYVVSALTWLHRLREDPRPPDYLIGHSLGEYGALFAAGAFDFETGLRLVRRRGELMSRADGGRMAAVLGCDLERVEQALAEQGVTGLDIANHNAPTQFVLAGPADEIEQAKSVFEGLGAHFLTLNVSAPFHSRTMRPVAEEFARYLDGFTLRDPRIPVIANTDARPYRPGEVRSTLVRQIHSPVLWTDSVRYLMGRGDFEFEELGPGAVLHKLVTRIRSEASPLPAGEPPRHRSAQAAPPERQAVAEPVRHRSAEGPLPDRPAVEVVGAHRAQPAATAASAADSPTGTASPCHAAAAPSPSSSVPAARRAPDGPFGPAAAPAGPGRSVPYGRRVSDRTAEHGRPVPSDRFAVPDRSVDQDRPLPGHPVVPGRRAPFDPLAAGGPGDLPLASHRTTGSDRSGLEGAAAAAQVAGSRPGTGGGARAETLGTVSFRERYGLRYAYLAGSMYGGVSGSELLTRLAKAGAMGFYGTGGVALPEVEEQLVRLGDQLGTDGAYGANLLHSPADPGRESALVDLFLRTGVGTVEASGFLRITPALVRYRLAGGRVLAKVSSTDMAAAFLAPPPRPLVERLVAEGQVDARDAERHGRLPMADDLCVKAGSAWFDDAVGSLTALLPAVLRLRDERTGSGPRVHVGAAGGISTPEAAAAAFMMGADFVLTGSVNQCTPQAVTSAEVKDLLQRLDVYDVALTPAPEMFELGMRVRAVRRGVFLPARAAKLHDLWARHESFEDIDGPTRRQIEESFLRGAFEEAAAGATGDAKARMAAAFRTYLDRGFDLARRGEPGRRVDYLVYCGPAMGAFNAWVAGTELASWQARDVDTVAEHLMAETADLLRSRAATFTGGC
ncbi:ACP S-malonyltransferase [Streptomyces sp. GD-15H]|uniref:ACP S-malonyltransferase n=1 Tax=Streptomyces sp. GD-15H TaxID=3129112 RepID=UPI003253B497